MIREFIADETTGPRGSFRGGWLFIALLALNEIRGIVVAYECAKLMGWI